MGYWSAAPAIELQRGSVPKDDQFAVRLLGFQDSCLVAEPQRERKQEILSIPSLVQAHALLRVYGVIAASRPSFALRPARKDFWQA